MSAMRTRSLLADAARAVARPVRCARGDRQHVTTHRDVGRRYLPLTGKGSRLRGLVEIVTDASHDARGDNLPMKVDADLQDDDSARQRCMDVLEGRFDVTRFDGVLRC